MKPEECLAHGVAILKRHKLAAAGNHVLLVSTVAQGSKGISSIVVHRIP
jgi:hypothetical protein